MDPDDERMWTEYLEMSAKIYKLKQMKWSPRSGLRHYQTGAEYLIHCNLFWLPMAPDGVDPPDRRPANHWGANIKESG